MRINTQASFDYLVELGKKFIDLLSKDASAEEMKVFIEQHGYENIHIDCCNDDDATGTPLQIVLNNYYGMDLTIETRKSKHFESWCKLLLPFEEKYYGFEEQFCYNSPYGTVDTLLTLAIRSKNLNVVKLLLLKGAEMNTFTYDEDYGTSFTPLEVAYKYGTPEIVQHLINEGIKTRYYLKY